MTNRKFRNKLTNEIWCTADYGINVVDQTHGGCPIVVCLTHDGLNCYLFDYATVSDFDRTWEDMNE